MKEIPLTKGYVALVDDADYEEMSEHRWQACVQSERLVYAKRDYQVDRKRFSVLMHRAIIDAPPDSEVDHADGNGLNNCRANLRVCSFTQNQQNRGKRPNTTSKYKGVSWHARSRRWRARICVNGKELYLGGFTSEKEAADTYDAKAREVFGGYARLNFA